MSPGIRFEVTAGPESGREIVVDHPGTVIGSSGSCSVKLRGEGLAERHCRIDATLDEAVHQLVVGHHQSLLVTDAEKNVVGVLRLTDVFSEICNLIKTGRP